MADSGDRHENKGGGGGFMLGLLTGTVLGAGLALLLAPKAGSELRGVIGEQARNIGNIAGEQARNIGNIANDQYKKASENATGWAERGREFVDKARDAVNRGAEEAREYASRTTGTTGSAGTPGSDFGRS